MEVVIYPVLFRIGTLEITSSGVLVALGALIGLWVFGRELRRLGLPAGAIDAAIAGVIGGMVGAKLLWVAEHASEEPLLDLVLSRGGMSWFGGFAGGLVSGVLVMIRKRIPVLPALAAATPALAIGHAVGHLESVSKFVCEAVERFVPLLLPRALVTSGTGRGSKP